MQHVSQTRLFLLALAVCLAATCGLAIKKGAADIKAPGQEQRERKSPETAPGAPDLALLSRHVDISPDADEQVELKVDDGSFETAVGLTLGGTLYAVNRLTPPSYPATLTSVRLFFRHEQFGGGVAVGDPVDVLVAAHENGNDSIDLTQFQTTSTTIQAVGTFVQYDVPDITINSGDFLVGFKITHPP